MDEDETLYAEDTTVAGPQHNTIPINPYIAHVNQMESLHQQSKKPLDLKYQDHIDPLRLLIHRENLRPLVNYDLKKQSKPKYYIVEISRSKYKLYLIALKVPKKYLQLVLSGRGQQYLAGKQTSKVYYMEMTEKQGRKLI